jgi:hypothetical protein
MQTLTISKAKNGLSRVVRGVIRSRKTVIIRAPSGYVQLAPYEFPEEVPPAPAGSLGTMTKERLKIFNTFGETL